MLSTRLVGEGRASDDRLPGGGLGGSAEVKADVFLSRGSFESLLEAEVRVRAGAEMDMGFCGLASVVRLVVTFSFFEGVGDTLPLEVLPGGTKCLTSVALIGTTFCF